MDGQQGPPTWSALGKGFISAIQRCNLLVVFLSKYSVDQHGLLRTELINALSDWDKKEVDDVYIVLVRLEACKIPEQLENFQKFEALDDLKTPQLATLLRVLQGKAIGTLDFLPTQLEYKQRQIFPEGPTHCDIGVTVPQFDPADDLLAATNSLIEETAQDILEAFLVHAGCGLSAKEIKELSLERSPNDGFWLQPVVLTSTPSLISIEFYISTYRRGEKQRHHYTRTLNIDVENCFELSINDIVNDQVTAMKFFSRYCENALRAESDFYLAGRDWEFDPRASASQSFGFRNADLIFIFAPRDVGGHAFGRKLVELPFNDVYRILTNRTIDLLVGRYEPANGLSKGASAVEH